MLKNHRIKQLNNAQRWVLYDWANSVFATSVAASFFPIVLRNYWAKGLPAEDVTLYLGLASSLTSIILVFTLPFLGHQIDQKMKNPARLLFLTAAFGGGATLSLFFIREGAYLVALMIYIIAFVLFALGNSQYDSMLLKICSTGSSKNELHRLSSKGFLFGYLGGGLLLFLQSLLLIFHEKLGFSSALLPAKLCFLSAGIWWIVFSSPLLGMKKFKPQKTLKKSDAKPHFLRDSLLFLKTLDKKTLFFLSSFFLYIDVVFTMYKMALDFGLSIGLSQNHLIAVLILVQIIGAPGTLLMNWMSKKFNLQTALYFGIFCYTIVICASPFVKNIFSFSLLAGLIGLGQGGLQALSRSHFASLIESSDQGIGFGFFNVFGKLSAVLGPLVVGLSTKLLGGNTYSILMLLPFLVLSALFLKLSFGCSKKK